MTEVIRNIDKFKGCIEANYIDLTERKELHHQQHHFTIADIQRKPTIILGAMINIVANEKG
jgi:hypothetical protein